MRMVIEIYCGLISGYTAALAGHLEKKSLDKIRVSDGYCWRLLGLQV
jgi:hypothetical protein